MKKVILLLMAAFAAGRVSAQRNTGTAPKPNITYKPDTILYTTSSYQTPKNSTVDQLLKLLDGFTIDADGSATHLGQPIKKLTINGKRYGGLDVVSVIKTMPASIVQNVEMIDDYGDSPDIHKKMDSDKQLNINTKPKHSAELYDLLAMWHVKPFEELMAMRRGRSNGHRGDRENYAGERMYSAYRNNFLETDDYGDQIPHFIILPKPGEYVSLKFGRDARVNLLNTLKP